MKTIDVKETFAYNRFHFLAGINRIVMPSHVAKLRKSILTMGCIRNIVVAEISFLGKTLIYIIDGQHLFEALRGLELPIPYVMIKIKDKKDLIEKIALLNASSKSWKLADYITAWKLLNPEYIILEDFHKKYNLSFVGLTGIAMNLMEIRSISPIIKSGKFTIQNTRFEDIVRECRKLLDQIDVDGISGERFVIAYVRYINNNIHYNFNHILSNMQTHKTEVEYASGDRETFYRILNEIIFC